MKHFAILLLSGFLVAGGYATEAMAETNECADVFVDVYACTTADQMVLEMRPQLPMKKGDGSSIVDIANDGAMVDVRVDFETTAQEIKQSLVSASMSIADLRYKAIQTTYDMTCRADVFRAFLDLGGEVRYTYYSLDSKRVFEVLVVSCNDEK